jgi:hypothetical protein
VTTTNFMEGIVTVSGTTMTMTSDATGGSGTFASWTISVAGNVGSQGATGAQGATGPQGPVSSVTVSDTDPVSPTAGDVWYESDTGILFIRYDSYWVEVAGGAGTPSAATTTTGATGVGYMGLPQNSATTGAYTIVAADAGKHIYSTATRTVTIPSNASLAMPVGSTVVFVAGSGATVTIAITTDTMYLAGPGTTGSRTLAAFGMATAVKITSTSWIISGNGLT